MTNDQLEEIKAEKRLEGIGGWLGWFAFTNVIGIFRSFAGLIEYDKIPAIAYEKYPIAFYGALGIDIIFIIFHIYTLTLLFKHKRVFVKTYIKLYFIAVALPFIAIVWISAFSNLPIKPSDTQSAIAQSVGIFTGMGLWILYLLKSKRVKNTFVK
jgi:hypothetical protein